VFKTIDDASPQLPYEMITAAPVDGRPTPVIVMLQATPSVHERGSEKLRGPKNTADAFSRTL
jgi:hypothetical protein